MKKDQVQIGRAYVAKVSGQLARVRIDAASRFGGWDATNIATNRKVRIKSAQRLRREVASERTVEPATVATTVVEVDRPPQDIDLSAYLPAQAGTAQAGERLAAAPPSIVPREVRRARAEAAQAEAAQTEAADDNGPRYDRSRCATPRCRGTPVMTYIERPLCQACWDRHCAEEQSSQVSENACRSAGRADDACRPTEEPQTPEQENAMSKKKSNKQQSTRKQTKAPPVAAKARAEKKAAAPKATATTAQKPKRISALDAAAQVLAKAGKPMRAQELIAAMAEQNLWTSPGGKTPHATVYAAMMREARSKGGESRFRKVDRGQFQFAGKGK